MVAPADGFDVLSVGAVDDAGSVTYFSSPGPTADGRIKPDVAALGLSNTVAHPNDDQAYLSASGTSFSCPLIVRSGRPDAGTCPPVDTRPDYRGAASPTASQTLTPDNDLGGGSSTPGRPPPGSARSLHHDPLADTEDMVGPYIGRPPSSPTGWESIQRVFFELQGQRPAPGRPCPWSRPARRIPTAPIFPGHGPWTTVEYYLAADGNQWLRHAPALSRSRWRPFRFTTGPWRAISYAETRPREPIPDGVGWGSDGCDQVPVVDSGLFWGSPWISTLTIPDQGEVEGPAHGTRRARKSPSTTIRTRACRPGGELDRTPYRGRSREPWMTSWNCEQGRLDPESDRLHRRATSGTLNSWGLNFTLVRYVTPVEEALLRQGALDAAPQRAQSVQSAAPKSPSIWPGRGRPG